MRWQYFLGCRVRNRNCEYTVVSAKTDGAWLNAFSNNGQGFGLPIDSDNKNFKPILRPLSSMTEEEKREFNEAFCKTGLFSPRLVFGNIVYVDFAVPATTKELLYLMEKGFFVNQCREDECILED